MTIKEKIALLTTLVGEMSDLQLKMEEDEAENTDANRELFDAKHVEAVALKLEIQKANEIEDIHRFLEEPAAEAKSAPLGIPYRQGGFQLPKTLGEMFVETEAYQKLVKEIGAGGKLSAGQADGIKFRGNGSLFPAFGQKATFTTTGTGLDTTVNYISQPIVLIEQQRLTIRDLLPVGQTTMNSIPYIAEVSFTNAADTVAEEGEKPEATLVTEDRTAPIKKIAVVLKVTDEMFSDFPVLRDYINSRLRFMVEQKEEQQLLNGTGVGSQITGILQTTGVQTQAKAADTVPDAIYKGMTKIRVPASNVGGYEPSGIVIHPNDWQEVRLLKDGNTQYYAGGPFTAAYGNGPYSNPESIWGLPVVKTTAITEGTALVGDFRRGAQIWQRDGISLDSTNSNEDDFNFNRISLRVEERLGLAVYRPSAFCTITGI